MLDAVRTTDIGRNLRQLRRARELTLARLSKLCEVSASTLSKIETGQVAPSFDTMLKIAGGLGVSFEELLGTARRPVVSGMRAVTRADDAVRFATGRYDYRVHSAELRRNRMIPLMMEIRARTPPEPEEMSSHFGEEFILVVEGTVEMHTAYYEPVTLEAGDSAYIDSLMPHGFVNRGAGRARMLSVCLCEDTEGQALAARLSAMRGDPWPPAVGDPEAGRADAPPPARGRQRRGRGRLR